MNPRRAALALGVVVAVSAYWWGPLALRPVSFFEVRRVEVSGSRYLAPEAVVVAMRLGPGASVFDDLHALERRLGRSSGIAQARVRRRLPATLVVEIVEEEPVALAELSGGLVPLAKDGGPLPYDVARVSVDAPIVPAADRLLLEALSRIRLTDLGLFTDVSSARERGGEVVLDLTRGRVRLDLPVDPEVVRSVSAVRRDLAARGLAWWELDGRFKGWVVVRRDGQTVGRSDGQKPRALAPNRSRARPFPRRAVARVTPRASDSLTDCPSSRLS